MSKKRRTKKEKIIAQLRRRLASQYKYKVEEGSQEIFTSSSPNPVNIKNGRSPFQASLKNEQGSFQASLKNGVEGKDYSYIRHEIKKTFLITSILVALNMVLFAVEKNLNFKFSGL